MIMRFLIRLLLVKPIKPRAMLEASLLIPHHSSAISFYVLMKKRAFAKMLRVKRMINKKTRVMQKNKKN
jgi:hypothetical protein